MRNSMRAAARIAFLAGAGFLTASTAPAAPPAEQSLPESTYLLIKIPDVSALKDAAGKTQFAQLFGDEAWNPIKEDFKAKLEEANNQLQQKVGLSIVDLLDLPQGQVSIAVVDKKDDPKIPVSLLITVDAGKNDAKLDGVLTKITQQVEAEGNKVSNEEFQSLTLHVIRIAQEKDEEKAIPVPFVWTKQGSLFHLSTDVDAIKEYITNSGKRETSLATTESFTAVSKKLGKDPHVFWYFDLAGAMKKGFSFAGAQEGARASSRSRRLQPHLASEA